MSDPATVSSLHARFRIGLDAEWKEQVLTKLTDLEAKLSNSRSDSRREADLDEQVQGWVDEALRAALMDGFRTFSLAMSPVDKTSVGSFLDSTPDSVAEDLENPPRLRSVGWGVETDERSRLVGASLRRTKSDEYKILDLHSDGTLVFCCRADETMLGWGESFGASRLNPLALIETIFSFFTLYERIRKRLVPPAEAFEVWIQFRNLHRDNPPASLSPYGVNSIHQRFDFQRSEAPDDNFRDRFSLDPAMLDPAKSATLVAKVIYGWFGFETDKIPYLTKDRSEVDVEKIRNPKPS